MGEAGRGLARPGLGWVRLPMAGWGEARPGQVRVGRARLPEAGKGTAELGPAGFGWARHDVARSGYLGLDGVWVPARSGGIRLARVRHG